jgi:hypothetical protein
VRGGGSFEDLQRAFDTDGRIERLNSLSRQLGELAEDERARGNSWFGSSFRNAELDKLLELDGTPWRDWLAPALGGSQDARRVLSLCRGFYEAFCSALFTIHPPEGLELFEALTADRGFKIVDGHLDLPLLQMDIFAAPDSPQVEQVILGEANAAARDIDLFEFALMFGYGRRPDRMRQLVDGWRKSDDMFDRARALVLLGFSDEPYAGERLNVWIANNGDCWLRDLADVASRRYRRNAWAQTWFERFLERENRSESWAAFRLFLRCTDRRFWLWLDRTRLQQVDEWKRDALTMSLGTIESACKENEKAWKDEFIGQKVKLNELWPWMEDYR